MATNTADITANAQPVVNTIHPDPCALECFKRAFATQPFPSKIRTIVPMNSPSNGEVIGIGVAAVAVVVIGVVVLVEVNKSHHTIKGCVSSGPGGLEVLNESDKKVYALMGVPPNVKVGDVIKVHGKKEKQGGAQEFVVEKMSRDYGPCKAAVASSQP